MSKKASLSIIGGFVVGAVALLILGALVFGSGRFFKERSTFVAYFDGSVKGLNVGAPVVFRGVKVGEVREVRLQIFTEDLSFRIPVIFELEQGRAMYVGPERQFQTPLVEMDALIESGLRAQLQLQSPVTGQLFINLDFYPDRPAELRGLKGLKMNGEYREVPTIPSSLEELSRALSELPLEEMVQDLKVVFERLKALLGSKELEETLVTLKETLGTTGALARKVHDQVDPLSASIKDTLSAAESALRQAQSTLAMREGAPGDLSRQLNQTLASAQSAADQAQKAFAAVEDLTAEDAPMRYQLEVGLEELTAAARSIRVLAEYLEKKPDALIRGKAEAGGR